MTTPLPFPFTVRDLKTGCELLARISLANPWQAAGELDAFLDSLLAAPPDGEIYFRLLEHARVPICFVQEELAKRYLNKTLPLAELEEKTFQRVIALWLKTARAYAHCLDHERVDEDDPARPARLAVVLHRCIYHVGMAILEHQQARRELPWGLWLDLHGYFGSAEDWDIATLAVADPLDPLGRAVHCTAAYVSFILVEMAGGYGLPVREQRLVRRWATYWAPLVGIHRARPGDTLPPFVIDLMQDVALRPVAMCLQTENVRRLDTSRLAMHMVHIRQQLHERIPPAQLALGEDCTAGQCNRLLHRLSRPWSQVQAPRRFKRHATSGTARLCTGFDEIHYFVSGKEFEQPENARVYSRHEFESLFAFRYQENPQEALKYREERLAYRVDTWEIVNQSANGFRLVRSAVGKSMAHDQLVALCPHDGGRFLLARNVWLMQEKGGGLIAGLMALPGLPSAIAARPVEPAAVQDGRYHRAFLLPAVPAVSADASLVLPRGWYRRERLLDLFIDTPKRVQLVHMLEDGVDFERVSFVAA